GQTLPVSLNDINAAVGAINDGFDECRALIGFTEEKAEKWADNNDMLPDNFMMSLKDNMLSAYPNPFSKSLFISFELAQDSRAMLQVFDSKGALVKVLFDGAAEADMAYNFEM